MINLSYTANNGTVKVLALADEYVDDKFRHKGKTYQIDRSGQYPLFQVACMGKCNTYWRTIGRYPTTFRFI